MGGVCFISIRKKNLTILKLTIWHKQWVHGCSSVVLGLFIQTIKEKASQSTIMAIYLPVLYGVRYHQSMRKITNTTVMIAPINRDRNIRIQSMPCLVSFIYTSIVTVLNYGICVKDIMTSSYHSAFSAEHRMAYQCKPSFSFLRGFLI